MYKNKYNPAKFFAQYLLTMRKPSNGITNAIVDAVTIITKANIHAFRLPRLLIRDARDRSHPVFCCELLLSYLSSASPDCGLRENDPRDRSSNSVSPIVLFV